MPSLILYTIFISLIKCSLASFLPPNQEAKIGPDVREAIESGRPAQVVIALRTPKNWAVDGLDEYRRAIREAQNDVLIGVSSGFRTSRKFGALPALSGDLTSENALQALAQNPLVQKVDLDVGGTGGGLNSLDDQQVRKRMLLDGSVPLIGADERIE